MNTTAKELALKLGNAYSRLDVQGMNEILSDEVEWSQNKTFSSNLSKKLKGFPSLPVLDKNKVNQMMHSRKELVDDVGECCNVEVIIEDGEKLIVTGRMCLTKADSILFNEKFFLTCEIRDGKIKNVQVFEDTAKLLKAYEAL